MPQANRPVALVTGSSTPGGIGAAVARRLAVAGHRVIVHSRSSDGPGADAAAALAAELDGLHLSADLTDAGERDRLVRDAAADAGRLDVLINNAGRSRVIAHGDLAAATPEVWHELYEVNVVAPFALVAAAAAWLRAGAGRPGAVVNVASHAGVRPKGASVPYAASKAALVHVTKLLALSLGPDVRVNAVAPGLVDTPLTADWTDARTLWRERAPMRRAATPDDVAGAVLDFVESGYVTGEVLTLDGGLNLT